MPDSPQRPAQIEGGPVPGERGAASLVPFGLDQPKPRHYRQALRAAWDLRDEPFFAWDSLAHGVCDACALGSQGLRDSGLPGWHVCPPRLDRLRGLCAPPLAPADLLDIRRLRGLSADALRGLGRLPYPFLYEAGARGFTRVPWELAVDRVSESLAGFDPDSCAWALGAQHLCDEASYVIAKSARALGCPHVDLDSGPAWRAARAGLEGALGQSAATVGFRELLGAELILLWGGGLSESQPGFLRYLERAKRAGARVVLISSAPERGLELSWDPSSPTSALLGSRVIDDLMPVKPGGVAALARLLSRRLLDAGAVDAAFLEAHTEGFEGARAALLGADPRALEAESGAHPGRLDWLATLLARARRVVSVLSTAEGAAPLGEAGVAGVIDLHLLRGALGTPGAGLLPLPGQPAAELLGGRPDRLPGQPDCSAASAGALEALWGFAPPAGPGRSLPESLALAEAGGLRVLVSAQARLPASEALERVDLRVHLHTHLTPEALVEPRRATLLLPLRTAHEQRGGGLLSSAERRVRLSPELMGPPLVGEARPAWRAIAAIARETAPERRRALRWEQPADVRAEMARVLPHLRGLDALCQEGDQLQWGGAALPLGGAHPGALPARIRFSTTSA